MTVTTLSERKFAEARRRRMAADDAVAMLREFARSHGGRFVIFGSYATDTMRFDSDLDVLVDFPQSATPQAWRFAEEVAGRVNIDMDLHDARTTRPAFVERVRGSGMVLE